MAEHRNWKLIQVARVYCPLCDQWYDAIVLRKWYVERFVRRPQTPVLCCYDCRLAVAVSLESGGRWEDCRNWERRARDGPPATGLSPDELRKAVDKKLRGD